VAVEFWRMGATPVPSAEIERFARAFEDAGWDGFAIGEAHGLIPDPYIVLARAAAATTSLQLATAVAVPLRAPLLAASAMATLHGVAGGRTSFSIGRGDGAVKVLKRKPMAVTQFEAYLAQLQAYLRGDDVEVDGVITSMGRLYDIDPSLGMTKPPVDVAATGPRTVEVAVKTADGVSFSVGADVERLRRNVLYEGRRSCQGRSLELCRAFPAGERPGGAHLSIASSSGMTVRHWGSGGGAIQSGAVRRPERLWRLPQLG
jgi:5,10-methylenetetrahydromethanopterin reductase